jgi:SAM-dependent MidA family methyltransferase
LNKLTEIIAGEIKRENRQTVSFARFLELALYCPEHGYYEKECATIGRDGDFFSSVSVGSLFGELLAFQFAQWLESEAGGSKPEARIVEAGAHDGKLARDILNWLEFRRPKLVEAITYCIVEPSARRQQWQKETLKNHARRVRWFENLRAVGHDPSTAAATCRPSSAAPHFSGICGIIFSNELLDAMPVHRLGWDAVGQKWFEWGVTVKDGRFLWARMPRDEGFRDSSVKHQPPGLPDELLNVLPDGFTTEISPAAANWWREAATLLQCGKLLTIDYGLSAEEFFMPERRDGTLRAYHRHHRVEDLLANVGEQDITAHVNFTAIRQTGEAAGLQTEAFLTQAQFLMQIARNISQRKSDFGAWTSARVRAFQTLAHPEHLGRSFRVLIQSKSRESG